jgi:hypothetical protein
MSRPYYETLTVVRNRLRKVDPSTAAELDEKIKDSVLRGPSDDPRNRFHTTINWPAVDDPYANVNVRVNFPDQRLREGVDFLGISFLLRRHSDVPDRETELKIVYGANERHQIVHAGSYVAETVTDNKVQNPNPVAVEMVPISHLHASILLHKFGIVEHLEV